MSFLDKAKKMADKDKLKKMQEQAKVKIDEAQQKLGSSGSKKAEEKTADAQPAASETEQGAVDKPGE